MKTQISLDYYLMWLRGIKTAALHEVRLFRQHLINVHSGVALKKQIKHTVYL